MSLGTSAFALRAFLALALVLTVVLPIAFGRANSATPCPAGAIAWIGGDGNWSDAANWDGGSVPGAADSACVPAGVTVTVTTTAQARTLISDGTIDVARFQTLSVGRASETRTLALNGFLTGAGSMTILGTGSTWTQGSVTTSLVVAPGADLAIVGNSPKNLSGSLVNRGTVTQSGRSLRLGTVTNHGTWLLTNTFDATMIDRLIPAAAFTNHGTFERASSGPSVLADVTSGVRFANLGTILARTGVLQIADLASFGDGASLNAEAGALFIVSSFTGVTVSGSSTIDGDGTVEWRAGSFKFQAGAVVDARDAFLLRGATIAGPGILSISGPATWTNGTISGTAEVAPGGHLTIDRFSPTVVGARRVTGTLINRGEVTQPDEGLHTSLSGEVGEIVNEGAWRFANTSSKSFMIRGDGPFTNEGILEGSDRLASNQFSSMAATVDLVNRGTVRARSGQLWIRSATTHYPAPTTFVGGIWEARDGSSLHLPSTFTENNAALRLTGAGSSIRFLSGSDVFSVNSGSVRLSEGADYTTAGAFTNNGTIEVANAGAVSNRSSFTVSGDLTLGPTSTVEVGIGGSPATNLFGEIVVTGEASLGGTLAASLLDGFLPDRTDSYRVMAYPARAGSFSAFDTTPFAADVTPTATFLHGTNPPPVADAGPDRDVDEGSTIQLDGSGSVDPGGEITAWSWRDASWFSAGADGPTPTFANTADDGQFTVDLTVCDIASQCDTDSATVTVNNVDPSVTVNLASEVPVGDPASLGVTFSDPGREDTHVATIDWGDGAMETIDPAASPIASAHRYATPGRYRVVVTVTDDDGGSSSVAAEITVAGGLSPPEAATRGPYEAEEGERIQLSATPSSDEDGTIVAYQWTSDGGTFSDPDIKSPRFHADEPGIYTLTVTVTDNDGLTDTATTTVTVSND